jgi:DNA/RNA endonuclease G (NUC1)
MLLSTFSYLNCVLQHQDLNRGAWRLLEEHERQLSSTGTVKVSILMVYGPTSVKLPTGATVPDGFYKYITVNNKTTIYFFKNERPLSTDYTKYVVAKGPKLTLK